ncbi:hypothetical protein B0H11DRAFT_2115763 [Mycena galericulata]|nr:hypothetical protein B0H11DRAFT_2115763 [Mycena galericulata]
MSSSTFTVLLDAARNAILTTESRPYPTDLKDAVQLDTQELGFKRLTFQGRNAFRARLFATLDRTIGAGKLDPETILTPLVDAILIQLQLHLQGNDGSQRFLAVIGELLRAPDKKRVETFIAEHVNLIASAVERATTPSMQSENGHDQRSSTLEADAILAHIAQP